ncbi:MFS transporter [Polymorphobacter sp. PAMC 29334]|uniref:MFS transporter n=1 Tax=Polymorphobacter sp. PAMC 29334 TaxID=2862331 RepID=UPI001C77D7B1|nr:MFS transporter [Polymorphobacter sp. PAMC 29334]QYE34140.1 MFS transporter [Polymorphobacter sp. PAMC 29334]
MATQLATGTGDVAFHPQRDRLIIVASSLGTIFEWYDFFVYGTLAALLGRLFFPSDNPTAGLLLSLATFGAGFGVRPIGALIFGVLGDRIGRKHTFLATITLMGIATALVGFLPTFTEVGIWAPALLVGLRLLQGLALGGEYGGAAIYVAEHAPKGRRGFFTSFIQASVVGGFLLSLMVVLGTTALVGKDAFAAWGWRIPFIVSLPLLAISLYIRLKLRESPIFMAMKAKGKTSANPLRETFGTPGNVRLLFVALFGIAAGLTVIWYTAQFSVLYFLHQTALVDETDAKLLCGATALLSAPFFVLSGHLSDRWGRRPMIIGGYGLTLLLLFPLFHLLSSAANPTLAKASAAAPITVTGVLCHYDPFAHKQDTACGEAMQYFSARGIGFHRHESGSLPLRITVGGTIAVDLDSVGGQFDKAAVEAALAKAGYPTKDNPGPRNNLLIVATGLALGILSAMTYGPVAAVLVELFPARIRYTSMSIPYHIGTGYFGGFLPLISQFIIARTGDPFGGLWYTFAVVAVAFVVTLFALPETKDRDIC